MTTRSANPPRRDAAGLLLFSAVFVAAALYWSIRRELWYDELFVAWIAEQPSLAAVWRALAHGADNHPPLYYLLAHLASGADWALRLPSIVATLGALLCVYAFVLRIASTGAAWLAVGLLLAGEAALWSVQARGYSLTLFFAAASLLAWHARRVWITAACLALGCWSGWYCVLLPLPLMAGQWLRHRRDLRAWASLTLPWISVAPLLPLASAASSFSAGFWAAPKITRLPAAYAELFGYAPLALAAGLAALALVRSTSDETRPLDPLHRPALVAAALCALLPLAVFALAVAVTNAFHARAAMIALPGMAAAAAILLRRHSAALAPVALCVGLFHLAAMPLQFPHQNVRGILRAWDAANAGRGDLPLLADGELYLPVARYRGASAALVGESDHVSLALGRLSEVAPVARSQGERRFRLLTWKPETLQRLAAAGYRLGFVAQHGDFAIYHCERP